MPIPSLQEFFLETPLYEQFAVSEADGQGIFSLLNYNQKIDAYCPDCDKHSTFKGIQQLPIVVNGRHVRDFATAKAAMGNYYGTLVNRIHHVNMVCTRDETHLMEFSFYLREREILKIGQFPSIADLSMPDLKKYREVLSKESYKELNRGVGLITHGVGVGAFVYLRRIFEELIDQAHKMISKNEGWNEDTFQRARMDEKIESLKTVLPEFLVQNRKLYAILSKGIHELTEEECLEYFPTVKLGVELILDEKLEEKRKKDKISHAKKSLEKLQEEIESK